MVLSSTQSARCSGDHLPRDARAGLRSAHFVSAPFLLGIGVLSYHAVREVQRGVQQRIGEDGGRVAPEVVGSTARPAAELAVRHPHVIAHPPVIDMPRAIELACWRERTSCTPWCVRSRCAHRREQRRTPAGCGVSTRRYCVAMRQVATLRTRNCSLADRDNRGGQRQGNAGAWQRSRLNRMSHDGNAATGSSIASAPVGNGSSPFDLTDRKSSATVCYIKASPGSARQCPKQDDRSGI